MATPAPVLKNTTKSGIDLTTFEDVKLFKKVPEVSEIHSIRDALSALGNDEKKLLEVIHEGMQAEAVRTARDNNDGWLMFDEDGKETDEVFTGTLVEDPTILNQTVLTLAKVCYGYEEASAAKDPDAKRKAKESAMEHIKNDPKILAGLKSKIATK